MNLRFFAFFQFSKWCALLISTKLIPIFLNLQRSEDDEKRMGEEEEGQEAGAEGGVEVDEEQ